MARCGNALTRRLCLAIAGRSISAAIRLTRCSKGSWAGAALDVLGGHREVLAELVRQGRHQLGEGVADALDRRVTLVDVRLGDPLDQGPPIRGAGELLAYLEAELPTQEDVGAAVRKVLDVHQAAGRARAQEVLRGRLLALGLHQDHADPPGLGLELEKVSHQLPVARLEDVEPQVGRREMYDVWQGEEGDRGGLLRFLGHAWMITGDKLVSRCEIGGEFTPPIGRRRCRRHSTMKIKTALTTALLLALCGPLAAQVWAGWLPTETTENQWWLPSMLARAEGAWARRADGHEGPRARAEPVDEAIALYERALAVEPENLTAHWGLLRALYFRGEFVAGSPEERLAAHARGKDVAEAAFALIPEWPEDRDGVATAAPLLADRPDGAEVVFWGALAWGAWGDSIDMLTAVRAGVGGKVRMLTELAVAVDPNYADAGGHRILGRLHAVAPKVPFFTGWVDRKLAVEQLRRAVEVAPDNPDNLLFLAEALLEHTDDAEREARRLLEEAVAVAPRPGAEVEHARTRMQIEERLAELGEVD